MSEEVKNQTQTSGNASGNVDPKIAAIREIIFGDNIKEFEKEFKKLNNIIDAYKDELEKKLAAFKEQAESLIASTNQEFDNKINELRAELNKRLDELANEKLDRKSFGSALQKLGDEIGK
ncbi:MAG TPA: hypothetical protein ENJ39_02095 [Flammeovirgaceae bacterium]|nr:hypothetical protein [Flammeovirgaceae bacterium]